MPRQLGERGEIQLRRTQQEACGQRLKLIMLFVSIRIIKHLRC